MESEIYNEVFNEENEEVDNTQINIFDNDQSILYKWHNAYKVPVKYLIAINSSVDPNKFQSLITTTDYDYELQDIYDSIIPIDFTINIIRESEFEPLLNRVQYLLSCNISLTNIYQIINLEKGYFIQDLNNSVLNSISTPNSLSMSMSSRYKLDYEIAMIFMDLNMINRKTNNDNLTDEDVFRTIFNYFESLNSTYNIDSNNLLTLHYNEWTTNYDRLNVSDDKNFNKIHDLQLNLLSLEPMISSVINITGLTLQIKPTFNNTSLNNPTSDDGIEIFDKSQISPFIPYIQLNNFKSDYISDDIYYKVYTGDTLDLKPNFNFIIPNPDDVDKPSSIYFTLWTGINEDITKSSKKLYETVSYYLKTNLLILKIPITQPDNVLTNQQIFIDRISQSLPIVLNNPKEIRAIGNFTIYNLEIVSTVLLELILNDPLFNNYLYVEESIIPFAEKERLDIHFKSIQGSFDTNVDVDVNDESLSVNSSLTAILVQDFLVNNTTVITNGQTIIYPKDTPVVQIRVTKAASSYLIKDFELIIVRLMTEYKSQRSGVETFYNSYFPNMLFQAQKQPQTLKTKQIVRARNVIKLATDKLSLLKGAAPEIFISGYARAGCQGKQQPSLITDEEVENWKKQTFTFNGKLYNRQVLPFPPSNPYLNLTCTNPLYPFPGIKVSILDNKEEFPYLPCCYVEDHMDESSNTTYNEVYRNKEVVRKDITSKSHKLGIDKILDPNRIGKLTTDLIDLLSINLPLLLELNKTSITSNKSVRNTQGRKPKERPYELNFYRYGVIRSPNSFLHCINVALRNKDYTNLSSEEDKEKYVIKQRLRISQSIYPSLLKQELYDYDDQQILEQLNNPDIFFDPSLFYRCVEEFFNINIFTFKIIRNENNHIGAIDYPRSKIFHANSLRAERSSICIVKHWGSLSNQIKSYPQCELIITSDNQDNIVNTTFDNDITVFLFNTLNNTQKIITWVPQIVDNNYQLENIENLYSRENYVNFISSVGEIEQQIIDLYGKLRGFVVKPSISSYNHFTIMFPPSQPENYPLAQDQISGQLSLVLGINENNTPSSYTQDNNELINGIWYPSGNISNLIYYSVIPTLDDTEMFKNKYPEVSKGPLYYIVNTKINEVKRLENLNRNNLFILHLIIWLYLLSKETVQNFMNNNFFIDQNYNDNYDFSNLARRLPINITFDKALKYLYEKDTRLVINNANKSYKIYLYSEKYAEGVFYFLQTYANTHKDLKINIPRILDDYYLYPSNFKSQPYVVTFIGSDSLQIWLKSLELNDEKQFLIKDAILPSLISEINPYLYESKDSIKYLIQNTKSSSLLSAINVAYQWIIALINPGYYSVEYTESPLPNHLIYTISSTNDLQLLDNDKNSDLLESNQFLRILQYSPDHYAAILQLE